MSEFAPSRNPEFERETALQQVVENYFPEEVEFVADMDFEDALGVVYGQLLETGYDPDEVLHQFGVSEEEI